MLFKLESMFMVDICNETLHDKFCATCRVGISKPNYESVYVKSNKLRHSYAKNKSEFAKTWPMSIGSLHSLLLHKDVVDKLIDKKIKGVKFHEISGIVGEVLNTLPSPPTYYKVEPLGLIDFFPSLEKFEILPCVCEIRPRYAGDWKAPFEIKPDSTIQGNFLNIRYYAFWVCVTKSIINILVENEWTKDFQIGNLALPGMRVREFGSTWYEDTLEQLRTSFPDSTILE